jgi:putative aldouronate transport system permease protein
MRYSGQLLWHPLGFSLSSYNVVFKNPNIWSGYLNTIFIVVVGVIFNIFNSEYENALK